MTCSMDCLNCKRPAKKCHGGNDKSAYDARSYKTDKKKKKVYIHASTGRKIGKQGVNTRF